MAAGNECKEEMEKRAAKERRQERKKKERTEWSYSICCCCGVVRVQVLDMSVWFIAFICVICQFAMMGGSEGGERRTHIM